MASEKTETPHTPHHDGISRIRRGADVVLLLFLLLLLPGSLYLPTPPKTVVGPFSMPDRGADMPNPFPMIEALRPQVEFWKKIFTRYDRSQVVIHDAWYLDVIYEVVALKEAGKNPRQVVQDRVTTYRDLLKQMAENWEQPERMTPEVRKLYRRFQAVRPSDRFDIKDAQARVRTQGGQADSFRKGVAWSGRYRKKMKKILAEHRLPRQLIYLPLIESAYNPFARSYVDAAGLWQLMGQTARQYGLMMNHLVDERQDPFISTQAAARHLAHNYEVLRSWPLAITAYNHGLQGMVTATRQVKSENIVRVIEKYDGSRFEFASRNFYPEFLAAVDVGVNYKQYYDDLKIEAPLETEVFTVPDYVSVRVLSEYCGLPVSSIRDLNPALLSGAFASGGFVPKGYALNLMQPDRAKVENAYASIPDTLKYRYVKSGQTYRVRRGQTLSEIAGRYNVSARTLMRLNGLRSANRIRPGQRLKLPGRYVALARAVSAAKADETTRLQLTTKHRVKRGETLSEIANRYGISLRSLKKLNAIRNSRKIRAGQVLKIPEG
ncbi:lytic transglycosylase [Desulfonema ishimotonii]|uniref:Lytic transglycosylase n=1 Tax=Desulfonema ishimotonii TaxID=45657 RepID=A0A401G3T0_9BACT|nr:lytic transglycosylase domain-containing protein [Desulfonema ishimotonii]GBC63890.1 lytic transglycosylase [Desulfonema ishimotonii]